MSAWTDEERAQLRTLAPTHHASQISEAIGRTVEAVRNQAARLDIKLKAAPKGYTIRTRRETPIDMDHAVQLYRSGLSPAQVLHAMPKGQRSERVANALRAMIEAGELIKHPPYRRPPAPPLEQCIEPNCKRIASGREHGRCATHRKIFVAGPCPYTPERLAELYASYPTIAMAASAEGHESEVLAYWMRSNGVKMVAGRAAPKEIQDERAQADRAWLAEQRAHEARELRLAEARRRLLRDQLPACEVKAMHELRARQVMRAMGVEG